MQTINYSERTSLIVARTPSIVLLPFGEDIEIGGSIKHVTGGNNRAETAEEVNVNVRHIDIEKLGVTRENEKPDTLVRGTEHTGDS